MLALASGARRGSGVRTGHPGKGVDEAPRSGRRKCKQHEREGRGWVRRRAAGRGTLARTNSGWNSRLYRRQGGQVGFSGDDGEGMM